MAGKNKPKRYPLKPGRVDRTTDQAMIQNDYAFWHYCDKIMKLACSCFKWEGLPETINEMFLERMLFYHGSVLFFYDEVLGYLALPSVPMGDMDIYNLPTVRKAYAVGAKDWVRDETNSVYIFNDILMNPSVNDMYFFASELYNNKRTRDINLNALKTPLILEADEDTQLSMENMFEQYDENSPLIRKRKNTDINGLNVLKLDVPYYVDKLDKHELTIWQQIVEYYGIPGVNNFKKERQTSEEVTSNLGATATLADSRLHARKLACKEINLLFGLDVDVSFNENMGKFYDTIGGDEDEPLYDAGEDDLPSNPRD